MLATFFINNRFSVVKMIIWAIYIHYLRTLPHGHGRRAALQECLHMYEWIKTMVRGLSSIYLYLLRWSARPFFLRPAWRVTFPNIYRWNLKRNLRVGKGRMSGAFWLGCERSLPELILMDDATQEEFVCQLQAILTSQFTWWKEFLVTRFSFPNNELNLKSSGNFL